VNDAASVADTATLVGGLGNVVADTEFESVDSLAPLTDRIVIDEYVVPEARPVTVAGLDVTPVITETPLIYTV
jgi:hypothetical protein